MEKGIQKSAKKMLNGRTQGASHALGSSKNRLIQLTGLDNVLQTLRLSWLSMICACQCAAGGVVIDLLMRIEALGI